MPADGPYEPAVCVYDYVCASTLDGIVSHQQQSYILIECIFILRTARTAFTHMHTHTRIQAQLNVAVFAAVFIVAARQTFAGSVAHYH